MVDLALLKKLEAEPLPRVILVHGQETVWRDRVFEALKQRTEKETLGEWNWSVFYGSKDLSLDSLLTELATLPWGGAPKIVVLRDAEFVPAESMAKLVNWLEGNPQANCLALFFSRVDGKWKFWKTLCRLAVEVKCDPLQGEALTKYIEECCAEQGKKIERVALEQFAARVGTNLNVIQNELDKLFAYAGTRQELTAADVQAVTSLWPAQIAEHTIFQLTDLIVQKKRQEALDVLKLLLSAGEVPLRILALIERQLRLLLAAKTSSGNLETAAREMGESSAYPLKKLRAQAKTFSLDEIFAGFYAVLQADSEIKLGATGEDVLTDLIIKLT